MPHALWLLNTTTLDPKSPPPDGCQCKYCAKKKRQSDVNSELRLPRYRDPKAPSQPRDRVFRLPKQKSKPGRPSQSDMPGENGYWPSSNATKSTLIDGHHTLRAETRPKGPVTPLQMPHTWRPNADPGRTEDLRLGYQSRDGELVWIPVRPPIPAPDNSCSIRHWPGMVKWRKRKIDVVPIPGGDESAYEVEESWGYTVEVLATGGQERNYGSSDTLPFLAYRAEDVLLEALKHVPPPPMEMLGRQSQYFESHSPFLLADNNQNSEHGAKELRFEDVAHQYSLALQIQANIAQYWCPLSPVGEDLVVTQVQKSLSTTKAPGVTQYEGLWWGPEKIWCGEMVRLICSHEDLAEHVMVRDDLRPRTFSEKDETEILSRGVLMHLREVFEDTIHVLNSRGEGHGLGGDVSGGSTIKVCRVAGTLYETLKIGEDIGQVPVPHPVESHPWVWDTTLPSASPTLVLDSPPPQIPARRQKPYLPPPPPFYRWHPLFHDGRDIILDATAVAGRYYPELLSNKNIPIEEEADRQKAKELLSLSGLYKGQEVAIQPTLLIWTRSDASQEGEEEAMNQLFEWWRERHLGNHRT